MKQNANPLGREPNLLIHEVSPYLLQHAYNPIEWHAWNEATFLKAQQNNKPVFLSIGYSSCHWCHVMEMESFEDEEIATVLNQYFISIKVDREERPDIDAVYMEVCQALTGHGGWPLTIVMTPEKKPFFAGTYFPKHQNHSRAGLLNILRKIKDLWTHNTQEVLASAQSILERIQQFHREEQQQYFPISDDIFNISANKILDRFDEKYGGMKRAPKFPTPHLYIYLLRLWKRIPNNECLHVVEKTALEMRKGGIFDHVGYGFHRYSTDSEWKLPHFEKMLYDQSMLLFLYAELYHSTKKLLYKRVSYEIISYIKTSLMSNDGLFYSAEDADSDGIEGKFYVWTMEEIRELVADNEEFELIKNIFSISENGNYQEEASRHSNGTNVLHINNSVLEDQVDNLLEKTEDIRNRLFTKRLQRNRPLLDDKVLTDWNGLIIAGLAYCARVFEDADLSVLSQKSFRRLQDVMCSQDTIYHRYREDTVSIPAFLDDVSCLGWASWELFLLTSEKEYLENCISYCDRLLTMFYDDIHGGFFTTSHLTIEETPFGKQKQWHDGAMPSGLSIACHVLSRMGVFLNNSTYLHAVYTTINANSENISNNPSSYSFLLTVLEYLTSYRKEIIISTPTLENEDYQKIRSLFFQYYDTKATVVTNAGGNLPDLYSGQYNYEKPCVYICENYTCQKPMFGLQEIEEYIQRGV